MSQLTRDKRDRMAGGHLQLYAIKLRHLIDGKKIVNRLCDHALGLTVMMPTEIRAAEILLRKCLPDLQAVELSGKVGGDITLTMAWKPPQVEP